MEDAFLLMEDIKDTMVRADDAELRLKKHFSLDAKRRQANLKTDHQRFLDNERVRD